MYIFINLTSVYCRERLDDAGSFLLMLVHTLAHINTSIKDNAWDDRSPHFIGTFFVFVKFSRAGGLVFELIFH